MTRGAMPSVSCTQAQWSQTTWVRQTRTCQSLCTQTVWLTWWEWETGGWVTQWNLTVLFDVSAVLLCFSKCTAKDCLPANMMLQCWTSHRFWVEMKRKMTWQSVCVSMPFEEWPRSNVIRSHLGMCTWLLQLLSLPMLSNTLYMHVWMAPIEEFKTAYDGEDWLVIRVETHKICKKRQSRYLGWTLEMKGTFFFSLINWDAIWSNLRIVKMHQISIHHTSEPFKGASFSVGETNKESHSERSAECQCELSTFVCLPLLSIGECGLENRKDR